MGTARTRRTAAVVGVVVALVLGACGIERPEGAAPFAPSAARDVPGVMGGGLATTTTTSAPATTTTLPPTDVAVVGSDGSHVNDVVVTAIEDLESFWRTEYPAVFDGDAYRPVEGGFYAFDSGTDPSTLPCEVDDIEQVLDNAFYCPPDDAVAWDQEGLLPRLAQQYGDFTVALVLAHEWGHAIQDRARVRGRTVTLELQADCFAGSWVAHVRKDGGSHFDVTTEDLDQAMAGLLALRDEPGTEATGPNAHGSGFDRVGSFQDGYEDGAARCAEYDSSDPEPFQFGFSSAEEEANQGNLPLRDQGSVDDKDNWGIIRWSVFSLEKYWTEELPKLGDGDAWKPLDDPVAFDPADPPTCGGQSVKGYSLFLCVPDNYIGYDDTATIPDAYEYGDFAVGFLLGTQYGLAVEGQLGLKADDEVQSTLWADCFAGAWAGSILPGQAPADDEDALSLSPGDLDEAVSVLLTFRSAADRKRQGPGFARVRAFRAGVVIGPDACEDLKGD